MYYGRLSAFQFHKPNLFDLIAMIIILGLLCGLTWLSSRVETPYDLAATSKIVLDYHYLPFYAARTLIRMISALILSLFVTMAVGSMLAKSTTFRKIFLPIIDICQSLPPLGMAPLLTVCAMKLFPSSVIGLELASVITIFYSQVWNMILSFYQSLITIPKELKEATLIFRLNKWQRFWILEVPHATPGLISNAMVSLSGSWFFVVASEALSVSNQQVYLPGIGSFIAVSLKTQNIEAIFYALMGMFATILIYDQLLFRPLLAWSEKFKPEIDDDNFENTSWFFDLLRQTRLISHIHSKLSDCLLRASLPLPNTQINFQIPLAAQMIIKKILIWVSYLLLIGILFHSIQFFLQVVSFSEACYVFYLGGISAIKVLLMVSLSLLLWVPIGVYIGSHRKVARLLQPIIQFLAAFPPEMFYPLFIYVILKYNLNHNIWLTPIMILGTQWYILFNVIAGTLMITKEQRDAAKIFGLQGWLLWKRLYLPAIAPYCITGAMAAAGGCWNVCVESDVVIWGEQKLQAIGLGAYIHEASAQGDWDKLLLGMGVMAIYVIVINRLVWNKLFDKISSFY